MTGSRKSELQFERELNEARIVKLSADHAERRIAQQGAGVAELNAIEEIENFGAELQAKPLVNLRVLENRDVVVGDAVGAHVRQGAG